MRPDAIDKAILEVVCIRSAPDWEIIDECGRKLGKRLHISTFYTHVKKLQQFDLIGVTKGRKVITELGYKLLKACIHA